MKYAFMSFSTPDMSLTDMLQTARRFGYDGIEPRMDAGHAHGIEVAAGKQERAAIRETVAQSGVELVCLATSLRYADPEKANDVMQQTRERIELAGDLGIPTLRVFGGTLPEGLSREDAIDTVVHCLGMAGDWAGERDVTICLETHDDWTDPRDVAAVMESVNLSHVAVNWDVMHPVRTGKATMQEAFERLKPWIRHLHVHDGVQAGGKLELRPIGSGEFDHRTVIRNLEAIDYRGAVSGEWIKWADPWEVHLPRELKTLRSYESA